MEDIVKESNNIQVEISNYTSSQLDNKFVYDICYTTLLGNYTLFEKELINNEASFHDVITKVEEKANLQISTDEKIIEKLATKVEDLSSG